MTIKKNIKSYLTPYSSLYVGKLNKKARDLWLQQQLSSLPNGKRILDAGAGELRNKPLCSHLDYVSQDFNQFKGNDLQAPGLGVRGKWDTNQIDIVSDIVSIPEPDESFDAILCCEVFEHIPNPIAAIKELTRLLKPRGILILTAPFCSLTHQAPYFFYTGYSRFFYEHWLKVYNLEILELEQNGNYFEYLAQEILRLGSVAKKYAGHEMNYIERFGLNVLLKFLNTSSKKNQGSEELLCYGFHLLARKNKDL